MSKKIKPFLLILFLLLGAIFLALRLTWLSLTAAPKPSDTITQRFIIYKGEGISIIAKRLQEEGLIKSALIFKIIVLQQNLAGKVQSGDFQLSPSMDIYQILQQLKVGVVDKWVTLIEGWRVEEMAAKLNQELGTDQQAFIKSAKEGYMFPDTYLFKPDVSPGAIAQRMEDNFASKYNSDLQAKAMKFGLTSEEGVILASIVEREARSDQARKMVASILLKRYKIGMALNADATIQYLLGYQEQEKSWWKKSLTAQDKKVNSPYNTYLYAGLPPKPISNPSLSALQAVANADPATPYLYYYHDSKGNSHYAKTLEEHIQNIAQYP